MYVSNAARFCFFETFAALRTRCPLTEFMCSSCFETCAIVCSGSLSLPFNASKSSSSARNSWLRSSFVAFRSLISSFPSFCTGGGVLASAASQSRSSFSRSLILRSRCVAFVRARSSSPLFASKSIPSSSSNSFLACCFPANVFRVTLVFFCFTSASSSSSFAFTAGVLNRVSLSSSAKMLFFSASTAALLFCHRALALPKTNQGTLVFISAAVSRSFSRSLNRVTSRSTPSFSSRSFSIFARLFVTSRSRPAMSFFMRISSACMS
mmetsp:Transcript_12341/g.41063  ORF Transcript_12341/g.41063 Transcript_12341/m.41063 type:complete len:266 (-) Transcript_12341:629-1426(-)